MITYNPLHVLPLEPNWSYHQIHHKQIIGTPASKGCKSLIAEDDFELTADCCLKVFHMSHNWYWPIFGFNVYLTNEIVNPFKLSNWYTSWRNFSNKKNGWHKNGLHVLRMERFRCVPKYCYKWQLLDHIAKDCTESKPKCAICAGNQETSKNIPCSANFLKCPRCGGDHPTFTLRWSVLKVIAKASK